MQEQLVKQVDPEMKARQNAFLDLLLVKLDAKNDAALSRIMHILPPVISKFRHGRLHISAMYIIIAHELTGMSIKEIKRHLGQPTIQEQYPLG